VAETVDAPVAPQPEKASLFEDFIDIFVSPAQVFARRANGGFFLVLVIVTVLVSALYVANQGAFQGIMDAEMQRATEQVMEQNPNMTAEQAEGMRGFMEASAKYGVMIGLPIAMLVLGVGVWLAAKVLGAPVALKAGMMIAAYSYIPRVLESVTIAIQGLLLDTGGLRGRYQLSLGVGRFLDPDTTSAGLLGVLGRVDVFTIWITILIGIGVSVVAKVPRAKGMTVAAVVWVLGAIPALFTLVRGG
jgi:hypothetical protein